MASAKGRAKAWEPAKGAILGLHSIKRREVHLVVCYSKARQEMVVDAAYEDFPAALEHPIKNKFVLWTGSTESEWRFAQTDEEAKRFVRTVVIK